MSTAILALDAGNTRLKWGLWQNGAWRGKGVLPSGEAGRLDAALGDVRPTRAWVSCVAGADVRQALAEALARLAVPTSWLVPAAEGHGLHNAYIEPARLGPDRYAMLVACLHLGLAPCVVVGAGTAVTVDALDGSGRFLGGLILPGPALMRQALASGTAGVMEVRGRLQDFPRCTGDAVETGIWRALAGAVEAMRGRLAGQAGMEPLAVLSGGEAAGLAAVLAGPKRVVEDLVLEGLLWVARDSDAPAR
jgi:type III pantothenate kinase